MRLVAFALVAAAASLAHAQPATPPVNRVVVYSDAALVTRATTVRCGPETVTAHFPGLPPSIDATTLRASAQGTGAQVEGLGVEEVVRREPYSAEVRQLDTQIEALRRRETSIERRIEQASSAREQAESLRQSTHAFLAREAAASPKPNVAAWTAALDVTREAVRDADARRHSAQIELRDVLEEIERLEQRRSRLAGAAPTKAFDASVVLRCRSGEARVELSYLTAGARWSPAYEARSTTARDAVELTVLADVVQSTGEDWRDVEVTLSTARARRDARPPEPMRLYVGAFNEPEKRKVLVRRDEDASHVQDVSDAGGAQQGADSFEAQDEGLSVQLRVPGRSQLPGDGRTQRLKVESLRLAATYGLVTVPKLLPVVLLSAEARNVARYPLLAGPVDLFSPDGYLGTATLEHTAQNDTLRLAFGVADEVKARRVVLTEQQKSPGFLSNRRLIFGYRIELESFASKPVTVRVQEHVPVSELDDVKVELDEQKTTRPFELLRTDGLVTWPVTLKPGEKRAVELHFVVQIPEKYDAAGL